MKNILKNYKINNNIIIFVLVSIVALIILYLVAYHQFLVNKKQYVASLSDKKIEEIRNSYTDINNGMKIKKEFIASRNNLNEIQIYLFKKPSINIKDIDVKVKLKNITENNIVYDDKIDYKEISNDKGYSFRFNTQKESKNKTYEIQLEFNDIKDTELKIGYSTKVLQENSKNYFNSKEVTGTLGIKEFYTSRKKIKHFNKISIAFGIVLLIYSIFIYTRKNMTPEKLFILIVPVISIIYLFVLPMYAGHDEVRHVLRIYEISEGHMLTEIQDEKVGTEMPKAIANGVSKPWREGIEYKDIENLKDKEIDKQKTEIPNMENVAVYSPVQYIPQSIGMTIAKLFTNNLLIVLYAARALNLIVCIVLLYLAIKKIPFGKMLIFIIAILPLSLEGISTMSPDGLTISFIILFIAYILDISFNNNIEKIRKKDIVILTIISIIISLCKIVYLPVVAMILLIPKEKYGNKSKKAYITFGIMLIPVILNLIWLKISNDYLSVSSDGSSAEKISKILTNPIQYLAMLLYTINNNGTSYLNGIFGSTMEMGEFVKTYFIVPFTFILTFMYFVFVDEKIKYKFSKFQNIVMILIILTVTALIFTSLYVQNTFINSMTIDGVQGRYFIPILLIIGLLLSNFKININYNKENYIKVAGVISIMIQMYIILAITIVHLD